jgi:hypothetical protein
VSREPRDEYLVLLPAAGGTAVLALDDAGELRWPLVTVPRGAELPEVRAGVAALVGTGVRFLRTAGRVEEVDPDEPGDAPATVRRSFLVHDVLETPLDELAPPASGRWVRRPPELLPSPPGLRGTVERWRAEQGGAPTPPGRPPWASPGGIDPFLAWLDATVRASGATPAGEVELVQQWGISLVARVPSDRGPLFGKAVGPVFAAEPAITELLARRHPGTVPDVLALDDARGWLLLADARIRAIEGAEAADGLRTLARVQRAWVGRTDELRAAGCPDRGPGSLADELAVSLEDLELAAGLEPSRALDGAARERVRALVPEVARLCRDAAADAVPTTLLHGDCHPANAGIREDGTVCLLDWSDAAVGHPFVDVDVWLSHVPEEEQAAVRDAYLAEWPDVPDAAAALRRADVLCAAYQVVTSQRLLHAVEEDERAGFAGGMSFWAGRLLDRYGHLVEAA